MNGAEHAVHALRGLGGRIAVLGLVVGLVAGIGAAAFVGLTVLMTPQSGGTVCGTGSGVPLQASGDSALDDEQRGNAAVIVATGRDMGIPDRGLWVALATALQESGLRNLDYGDRDSLGLFQQRPSQGWGSPAQVRDPRYAATRFYERLVGVPDWARMPLWQAAQAVQRSAFPLAYAKWEQTAADLLAEVDSPDVLAAARLGPGPGPDGQLLGAPRVGPAGENCGPGTVAAFQGGAPGCVEDDPTSNGCVTATTLYAVTQAASVFDGLRSGPVIASAGCFAERPANPTSDHPLGRGCDFFPGEGGRFARGAEIDNGWRVAEWFRANADALQVSYIIWQGRIWTAESSDQAGWGRPYTGGGVYDPSDAVGGHYDHLHVSFAS